MGISNRNDADKDLRALRRTGGDIPSAPSGYRNRAGQTVAQPGNDKAPYVWNAPFSEPMQRIQSFGSFASEHRYPFNDTNNGPTWGTCFPAVDVSDYRVISILLFMQTDDPDAELQLLPLAKFDWLDVQVEADPFNTFETWTPIAFVNPDPTNIQQEFRGFQDQQYSQSVVQRTMGALALKTLPPGVDGTSGNGVVQMSMDFEVGSHKEFTISTILASAGGQFTYNGAYYYTRRM
jgi:hypothetical protein